VWYIGLYNWTDYNAVTASSGKKLENLVKSSKFLGCVLGQENSSATCRLICRGGVEMWAVDTLYYWMILLLLDDFIVENKYWKWHFDARFTLHRPIVWINLLMYRKESERATKSNTTSYRDNLGHWSDPYRWRWCAQQVSTPLRWQDHQVVPSVSCWWQSLLGCLSTCLEQSARRCFLCRVTVIRPPAAPATWNILDRPTYAGRPFTMLLCFSYGLLI